MKKKVFVLLFLLATASIFSQQITRFAVVNTSLIFDTFRRDSKAARDYEQKKKKYELRIKELEKEIIKLRQKKVTAATQGKSSVVEKYEETIKTKITFLQEFLKAGNDELEMLKADLMNDDDFYSKLYAAIRKIGETEGYSMVLTLQQNSGIIWYSTTVDITNLVIEELKK